MSQEMKSILLKDIEPSKTNPRKSFGQEAMNDLTESVREKGVLQPILVRPLAEYKYQHFEIICGERRFRAATAAGLTEIPAVVRDMDDKTMLEVQLIENMQRSDVHPLEEAEGYELLMNQYGYSGAEQIAAKVGKSKSYVYGRMKLCALVPECRKRFYDGLLNPSTALLVARMPEEIQEEAAEAIEDMSYREAAKVLEEDYMLNLKGCGFAKDETILPDKGACVTCPKRTGNQELLFPDIKSADVCTDPECFKAKQKAFIKRQETKAQKTGLPLVKSSSAFYNGDQLSHIYVDLKQRCPGDEKKRTYGELLQDHKVKRCVAVDNKGKIKEIVSRRDADKIIYPERTDTAPRKNKDKDADELEGKVREITACKVMDLILDFFKDEIKSVQQKFWKVFAELLLAGATGLQERMMMQRIDPETKKEDAGEALKKHFEQIKDEECPEFVCELLAWPEWIEDDYGDGMKAMCELYGIDLQEIESSVRKELEVAKEKPEEPEGKKKRGPRKAKAKSDQAADGTKAQEGETNTSEIETPGTVLHVTDGTGQKMIVRTKEKLSPEEAQKAQEGLQKMAGLFGRI